jgi:hypothetical protein
MSEVLQGVSFPGGSSNVLTAEQPFQKGIFNVTEQSELAVATFKSLGFGVDQGEALEAFTQKFRGLHAALTAERADVVVEPFIGITLTDGFGICALKSAFDAKQKVESYYYDVLWGQYTANELNTRSMLEGNPSVAPDGVEGRALAMLHGGDRSDEKGLYFTAKQITGKNGQIEAVKKAETDHKASHTQTELLVVNPSDYVMINAQRREQGLPLLDRPTYTRFVQLAMKSAEGRSWLLRAYSDGGQLRLYGSFDYADSFDGVRLLMGQKPVTA